MIIGHVGRGHVDELGIENRGRIDRILIVALQRNAVAKRGHHGVDAHLIAGEIEEALRVGRDGGEEENKDEGEDKLINKMALNECIENLNIRERKIIFLRYYKCQTQKKVADIIGISQVQVSRIEKKILNNMKRELREA